MYTVESLARGKSLESVRNVLCSSGTSILLSRIIPPSAQHVAECKKCFAGQWFCQNIYQLLFRWFIPYVNLSIFYVRSKMMVLQSDVFRSWRELHSSCHFNAGLVVFMYFAYEIRFVNVERKYFVYFFRHCHTWYY